LNLDEYKSAANYIINTFPSLAAWREKLTPQQQAAQRDRNRACLMDCEHADVMRAVAELAASPSDPWPYDSDKERAGAIIATNARDIAYQRVAARRNQETIEAGVRPTAPSPIVESLRALGEELAKLKRQEGWTAADTQAWLDERIPPDESDRREWARCNECRDTGLITCLSAPPRRHDGRLIATTAVAACLCVAGRVYSRPRRDGVGLAVYDPLRHVRVKPNVTGDEAAEAMRQWQKARDKAQRVSEFDNYNAAAFT